MINIRIAGAAPAALLVLLAACEHVSAPGPALAPSLAARTSAAAAAVGAPPAEVQRASAVLAARVAGWDRPQPYGPAPERAQARAVIDAAAVAATVTPENLPAVARALDQALRTRSPDKPVPR
jgi:hypothetical protein